MDNEKNTSKKNEEKLQDQKLEGVSGGYPVWDEIKTLHQSKTHKRKKCPAIPRTIGAPQKCGDNKEKSNADLDFKF